MTDFYLDNTNAINRIVEEWRKYKKIVIAYDFDDTVYDFHKKGRTYNDVIKLLQRCKKVGAFFVVFTACGKDEEEKIKLYLDENEIPYDKINENLDFIKFTGRKVYYNIMLCDRAGLQSAYECLLESVEQIEKEII